MKEILSVALMCGALMMGAGVANANGIASAPQAFEITRGGADGVTTETAQAVVNPGDVVRGKTGSVQVDFASGHAVLVDQGAEATLTGADHMELNKGAVIGGKSAGEAPLTISYKDLSIVPTGDAEAVGHVYVGETPTGDLQVAVFDGSFRVADNTTKEGVASLGSGDAVLLKKVGQAWETFSPLGGREPMTGLDLIQSGALNEDVEKGIFLWWNSNPPVGIGVAAVALAAGGTGLTYTLLPDDDDDDDDDDPTPPRGPFSPVSSTNNAQD